jgi:cell fate (sporulation/competence/biofilm development) regulator YlbF (YheA/YmcA/DUF963 family)
MLSEAVARAVDRKVHVIVTQEIQTAARQLGQHLRQDEHVRKYLDAAEEVRNSPEACALETKMYAEYERLIAREQGEEMPTYEDTREFYELRQQVQNHLLISRRESMHRQIRPYLHQIAEAISLVLGEDYVALAKPH